MQDIHFPIFYGTANSSKNATKSINTILLSVITLKTANIMQGQKVVWIATTDLTYINTINLTLVGVKSTYKTTTLIHNYSKDIEIYEFFLLTCFSPVWDKN